MRIFNSIHKKSLSSQRRMDHRLNTLLSCVSVWVNELDAYGTFPVFNIKRLKNLSQTWVKNKDAVEHILATLPPLEAANSYLSVQGTHP